MTSSILKSQVNNGATKNTSILQTLLFYANICETMFRYDSYYNNYKQSLEQTLADLENRTSDLLVTSPYILLTELLDWKGTNDKERSAGKNHLLSQQKIVSSKYSPSHNIIEAFMSGLGKHIFSRSWVTCSMTWEKFTKIFLLFAPYHWEAFNNPEKDAFSKHCGKKEKMLVTSIFSFYHNVFYPKTYITWGKWFQFGRVYIFCSVIKS